MYVFHGDVSNPMHNNITTTAMTSVEVVSNLGINLGGRARCTPNVFGRRRYNVGYTPLSLWQYFLGGAGGV